MADRYAFHPLSESVGFSSPLMAGEEAHELRRTGKSTDPSSNRPFVSLLVPAFNESAIIESNLMTLVHYMADVYRKDQWEIIVVNDGSSDNTGELAEGIAARVPEVRAVHHLINQGLGGAVRTGAQECQGRYIVTLDLDLSYSPEHIERLLERIQATHAKVVVASPYKKGGRVSNVPWFRKELSVWANRFLSLASKHNVTTLTGLVRAYDADFLKGLSLKSPGMEINPEILHKAALLHEPVDEIPAHLCWSTQRATSAATQAPRKSSMKIFRHTWSIAFFGFLFRPVMFFIVPSMAFFLLAFYSLTWFLIHSWTQYRLLSQTVSFPDPTEAVATAFQQAPHTFVMGGMFLMLAIQLFSLGILSMQNKRYFEEVFYLGSSVNRSFDKYRR